MSSVEPLACSVNRRDITEVATQQGFEMTSSTSVDPLIMFTKLVPQRCPKSMVERSGILSRLRGEEVTPITLFQAPSGYGKTVAM